VFNIIELQTHRECLTLLRVLRKLSNGKMMAESF